MKIVGRSDLQGHTAYQPTIYKQGHRYIACAGHHGDKNLNPLSKKQEVNGTSILELTDPKYLAHVFSPV